MAQNRMNREEFYTRLAALDEERLKKAWWNPCPRREPVRVVK